MVGTSYWHSLFHCGSEHHQGKQLHSCFSWNLTHAWLSPCWEMRSPVFTNGPILSDQCMSTCQKESYIVVSVGTWVMPDFRHVEKWSLGKDLTITNMLNAWLLLCWEMGSPVIHSGLIFGVNKRSMINWPYHQKTPQSQSHFIKAEFRHLRDMQTGESRLSYVYDLNIALKFPLELYFSYLDFRRVEPHPEKWCAPPFLLSRPFYRQP